MALLQKEIRKIGFIEKIFLKFSQPSLGNKTNFFRLLAVSQKAGLGLREALIGILKSERHSTMKQIIKDLVEQINQGAGLGQALQNHTYLFGSDEIELIRSAETMGNMPETLEEIATELENYQMIQQKIKSALSYPTALIIFTIIAVAVLLIKVVPSIVSMFPDKDKLPRITLVMIDASDFLQQFWYVIIMIVGSIGVGYRFLYENILVFKIFIDKLYIKIPVLKEVTKTFYMYRFSKLLADFYHAGVSPVVSLEQMANIFENYHYKKKTLEIKKDLELGFGFAEAIEGSELFDSLLVQIILVGENTGNVGDVLGKMAEFYRNSLSNKIAALMGFIEPILMAFIAVVIGGIVGAIFLPMASLVENLPSG